MVKISQKQVLKQKLSPNQILQATLFQLNSFSLEQRIYKELEKNPVLELSDSIEDALIEEEVKEESSDDFEVEELYSNTDDFELGDGMYYNKWKEGNQIAMAQPLDEGYVDYDDGTENNLQQLSKDITNFLVWAAEPELEERKSLGVKTIFFLILITIMLLGVKRKIWKDVD